MKITEIIIEARILNEIGGIGTLLPQFFRLFEKFGAEKAFAWIVKAVKGTPTAVDDLAEAMYQVGLKNGWESLAEAEAAAIKAGMSKSEAAAAKKAAMARLGVPATRVGRFTAEVGQMTMGQKWELAYKALTYYSLWEPIGECAVKIAQAKAELDKNPSKVSEYNNNVQFYLAECVSKLAFTLGTKVVAGLVPTLFTGLPFVAGSKLARGLEVTSQTARAAALAWFASPLGRQALAEWITGESFSAGFVRNIVGGLAKTGFDKLESAISGKDVNPVEPGDADVGNSMATKKGDYDTLTGKRIRNF